jgi:predicted glutamine amidotransferase
MCGIVGYVSTGDDKLAREKEKFLREALVLDTFRGMDSTGVITVRDGFNVATRKKLGPGWGFVETKTFQNLPQGWAAIGHNRAATKGRVTRENAHPFTVGPISLVHNGTLDNMGRNLPDFCHKQDVDSKNIARALASVDPDKAAEEVLKHIQGAYALAWTDSRDESVNLVRNGQRPLHFAHNTSKTVLWFMSDGVHLELLKKNKWCYQCDMGQVFLLSTHKHFKFTEDSIKPEIVEYKPERVQSSFGFGSGRDWGQQTSKHSRSSTASKPSARSSKPEKKGKLSHRISLGGEIIEIPKAMIDDLYLTTELTPDDYLRFQPERWQAYPSHNGEYCGYGFAEGYVYLPEWDCEWTCVVHNVHERNSDKITLDAWEVIPYSTTADCSNPDIGFNIMARVKKFEDPGIDEPDDYGTEEEESEHVKALLGPFGRLYSYSEWWQLTEHGCSHCSRDMDPAEHEEVWWTGEMEKDPLCPHCAEEMTQPTTGETV